MMELQFLSSAALPEAVGPYSQGVKYDRMILTSGQIAIDPNDGNIVTDIKEATKMILSSLLTVVEAGGGTKETIAKVDVYMKYLNEFDEFNIAYAEFFGNHKPARVTTQAGDLAEGATIEIAVTAFAVE